MQVYINEFITVKKKILDCIHGGQSSRSVVIHASFGGPHLDPKYITDCINGHLNNQAQKGQFDDTSVIFGVLVYL